jgi:dihydrofolate reductase
MAKLVVRAYTLSLDGYTSAPNQDLQNPFGVGGLAIMDWARATRTFRKMFGNEGGTTGIDDSFSARADEGVGATIMGRHMFGPVRGPWLNDDWKGWWGPNPPYHHPVFVLTHHPRASLAMEGGTTFHFVTEGIELALEQAFEAAQGKDVRLGGGSTVVRQYLRARLIDELHLVVTPTLLGGGERLFDGTDEAAKSYEYAEFTASEAVAHVRLVKRK